MVYYRATIARLILTMTGIKSSKMKTSDVNEVDICEGSPVKHELR